MTSSTRQYLEEELERMAWHRDGYDNWDVKNWVVHIMTLVDELIAPAEVKPDVATMKQEKLRSLKEYISSPFPQILAVPGSLKDLRLVFVDGSSEVHNGVMDLSEVEELVSDDAVVEFFVTARPPIHNWLTDGNGLP